MAKSMSSKYKVTVKGPLLVRGDKNLMKGVRKALTKVGKSVTNEVKKNTPEKTGTLRKNIKEGKPTISKTSAQITISSGSSHGGASGVKTNSGGDVVYALWVETGRRRGAIMRTRKGGYKMFEKAEKEVTKPKNLDKMGKIISKQVGG
tara:strand:+ start:2852 stop:3295 length:444 start_codon:yes stop_codon:yes gene_type:complete